MNNPEFVAIVTRAKQYGDAEEYNKAASALTQALSIAPRDPDLRSKLYGARAFYYVQADEYNRALDDWNTMLKLDPSSARG